MSCYYCHDCESFLDDYEIDNGFLTCPRCGAILEEEQIKGVCYV